MAWRLARSLETLREQINARAPDRDKSSDGAIGDEAHASRSSDHNPWVRDGAMGVVTAIDVTHDPVRGVNAGALAETLRASGDPRIKYIISNRRIANSGQPWRAYSGANPHDKHFHVSVRPEKSRYDSIAPWNLGAEISPDPSAVPVIAKPLLKRGSEGEAVARLQTLLRIVADGQFGPSTENAVKIFQKKRGLVVDGKVGPYTWDRLET